MSDGFMDDRDGGREREREREREKEYHNFLSKLC